MLHLCQHKFHDRTCSMLQYVNVSLNAFHICLINVYLNVMGPPHPTPPIYDTFAHIRDGKKRSAQHTHPQAMLQMLPQSESHIKNESKMGPVNPRWHEHPHGGRIVGSKMRSLSNQLQLWPEIPVICVSEKKYGMYNPIGISIYNW